jgi:dihydropteroate synthase
MTPSNDPPTRLLLVTGRLAEPALEATLAELRGDGRFEFHVAVLPISVAALMTPRWIASKLRIPADIDRIILPGHCRGDLSPLTEKTSIPIEIGPEDLRDLPRFLGGSRSRVTGYGAFDIEILAEINHAPRRSLASILDEARRHATDGADLIDLGCDPDGPWLGVGDVVRALRDEGLRVSIDSFDRREVELAVRAGAELVLSVNASNRDPSVDWGVEVVAIPDEPGTLVGLDRTVEFLERGGVAHRLDPILEPIGFGFARSLDRYQETRRRYPNSAIMMGVGNLTELTEVDSAGVNFVLVGFCQELAIRSVLTTSVINWARSSVREIDLARRSTHLAVTTRTLPKHIDSRLVMLRDSKVSEFSPEALSEIQSRIKDPNWRIYAEGGRLHAFNATTWVSDVDPFVMFEGMSIDDPGHAFYLGYELAKAKTAATLGKTYRQDRALEWGFLTEPEISRHDRNRDASRRGPTPTADPEGFSQ